MSEEATVRRARQRSVYCTAGEQEAIREAARAAGKTVSRHVLELALADDPDRHPLALSAEEQTELLESVRRVDQFVGKLLEPLPEYGGRTLFGVVALLAGERIR